MDKKEFLLTIKKHCPQISEAEIGGYHRLFEGREGINFDKLYEHFLENWSYKNPPQAAFFASKLPPKRLESERPSAIETALCCGEAKIIHINPQTTEHVIEFLNGNRLSFYQNIIEAPFDRSKCVPPPKELKELLLRLTPEEFRP